MTITFENDNDVIVYALEKVIAYTRRTEQVFVAQCVWWLASIIGLEKGLVIHIDNIQSRVEVTAAAKAVSEDIPSVEVDRDNKTNQDLREVSVTPRDIQEDPRSRATLNFVHPSRRAQIQSSDYDTSDLDIGGSRHENILKESEEFISLSRKERKAATKLKHGKLSQIRPGKITKPVTKKQRNYLQSIPKDTLNEYLKNRK
jgi:hypothetical protein